MIFKYVQVLGVEGGGTNAKNKGSYEQYLLSNSSFCSLRYCVNNFKMNFCYNTRKKIGLKDWHLKKVKFFGIFRFMQ